MVNPLEKTHSTDTPEQTRDAITGLSAIRVVEVQQDPKDGAIKIVTSPSDTARATIETGRYIQISDGPGGAEDVVCLSSQIGCNMRCTFCASTEPFEYEPGKSPRRLFGSLNSSQIVDQALAAFYFSPPEQPDGIVFSFMGMGEPTQNMDEIIKAIQRLNQIYPDSRTTISTMLPRGSGVQKIRQLLNNLQDGSIRNQIKLHISLHASTDSSRVKIMPAAEPIRTALAIGQEFAAITDTKVKMNYVLVRGQNDSPEDAARLGELLRDTGLILKVSDLNPSNSPMAVDKETARVFTDQVRASGVEVVRFRSDGPNIASGCGQLVKGHNDFTNPDQVFVPGTVAARSLTRQVAQCKEY